MSVSRGENIVLTAKFSGDPVPERRWFYGKMEIKDGMGSVGIADKVDYEFLVKHVLYISKIFPPKLAAGSHVEADDVQRAAGRLGAVRVPRRERVRRGDRAHRCQVSN